MKNSKQLATMDFSAKVVVKLLLKGVEEGKNKNMLTSPLSYNVIMNIMANGSSNDKLTQILRLLERKNIEEVNSESSIFTEITREHNQRKKTIKRKIEDEGITWAARYHENQGDGPIISFLNGAWLNEKYRLKDSYLELVENLYKARVRNINVNEPETVVPKGLIKDIIETKDIKEDTLLIMANALYFEGSWVRKFTQTMDQWFFLLDNEKIKTPFMSGCTMYSHKFFEDCQVARIPYQNGGDSMRKFAMYILLPYEKDGLHSLLENVNSVPGFLSEHCDVPTSGQVDYFSIPKFKFSYLTEKAPEIMKGMGLTLPFDKENAEFYEMVKEEDLKEGDRIYVSKIVQKVFIEVSEEGTKAVALTRKDYCLAGCGMPPREPTKFIANHPFMFVIREENSGVIFFIGTVLNPQQD